MTKSALVVRDIRHSAAHGCARSCKSRAVSITTLDRHFARRMEPRASTPSRRPRRDTAVERCRHPDGGHGGSVIPSLNDHEIEAILSAAKTAGAQQAEIRDVAAAARVEDVFREWLAMEVPDRAVRVLTCCSRCTEGKIMCREFGTRGRGRGPYADQVAESVRLALKRLGLNERRMPLRTDLFVPPV